MSLPPLSESELSALSSAELDRVLELADARADPAQLELAGEPLHICEWLRLALELGELPEDPKLPFERVGRYIELRGPLRCGGSSRVYHGVREQGERHTAVAVKLLPLLGCAEGRALARAMWRREQQCYRDLASSRQLPRLLEADEHRAPDGSAYLYLCTEYKYGADLARWAQGRPLEERVRLFLQVCDAVQALHGYGWVHGDLKPPNVQVEVRGGAARPWLLDLGLAAVRGERWPGAGQLVGTPAYLSPEQISAGAVSSSTDVYALGLILFELLEGRPWLAAPERSSPDALASALRAQPRPRLTQVAPAALRDRLNAVLERAAALEHAARYREVFELADALRDAWAGKSRGEIGPPRESPFRGLEPFEEEHAPWFFGREAELGRLLERLRAQPVVAVIGASGSGKSSLLRAGLVAAVRAGELDATAPWTALVLRPGPRPLRELALRAANELARSWEIRELEERLREPAALADELDREAVRARPQRRFLIVVDPLEELFTQCADREAERSFLAALLHAASAPERRVRVVFALRADFTARALQQPELARALDRFPPLFLGAMTDDGLRAAISRPPQRAGLVLEPGLEHLLLQAVQGEPGNLPLLQFVLKALWEEREGRYLTLDAYHRMGGLKGALARRADAQFAALSARGLGDAARRLLVSLVQPAAAAPDVRRRLSLESARAMGPEVVDALIEARLLTASRDQLEVAHEALIREWDKLRGWVEEDRQLLRLQDELERAAQQWVDGCCDAAELWRRGQLERARAAWQQGRLLLSEAARRFLQTSFEAAERRARELARQAQQRKRAFALLAGGLTLYLVTLAAALVATVRYQEERLIELSLQEKAYAAQAQAGAVLQQIAEVAALLRQMAHDPEVAALARSEPTPFAPQLVRYRDRRIDSAVVFSGAGIMTAADPEPERPVRGRDFSWRHYFREAIAAAQRGAPDVFVARSFRSEEDDRAKFALAAPIFESGAVIGVALVTLLTDARLGVLSFTDPQNPSHTGVLLGPADRSREQAAAGEPLPEDYLVLLHDQLDPGTAVSVPRELAAQLEQRFGYGDPAGGQFQVSRQPPLTLRDHRDAFPGFQGRWLAAFAAVGSTGLVVGVQSPHSAAVPALPHLVLQLGLLTAPVLAATLLLLWLFLRQGRQLRSGEDAARG